MRKIVAMVVVGITLNVADNIYLGDNFNSSHSDFKEVYNRVISKNRARNRIGDSSYIKIDGREEFKEALKSGDLDRKVKSGRAVKTFRTIDISNVKLSREEMDDITDGKSRVIIGSKVNGAEKLSQSINIKNSDISTDKRLNIGVVVSKKGRVSGIESCIDVTRSSLKGGGDKKRRGSRLDSLDDEL